MNRRIRRYRKLRTKAQYKHAIRDHLRRLRRKYDAERESGAYILFSDDFEALTVNDGWKL